jgi:hypothetical protein
MHLFAGHGLLHPTDALGRATETFSHQNLSSGNLCTVDAAGSPDFHRPAYAWSHGMSRYGNSLGGQNSPGGTRVTDLRFAFHGVPTRMGGRVLSGLWPFRQPAPGPRSCETKPVLHPVDLGANEVRAGVPKPRLPVPCPDRQARGPATAGRGCPADSLTGLTANPAGAGNRLVVVRWEDLVQAMVYRGPYRIRVEEKGPAVDRAPQRRDRPGHPGRYLRFRLAPTSRNTYITE